MRHVAEAMVDLSFAHRWRAEVLRSRPPILPPRHYVFPREAEEVERGALEVLVRPEGAEAFLATCALGFRDPAVPSGLWSCPKAEEICAVSGGYAYLIDTSAPERFAMIAYRPVMDVRSAVVEGLLLFVGHRGILAWSAEGLRWESEKLSDEGVTVTSLEGGLVRGLGWELMSDRESAFALDLRTGLRVE